MNLYTCKTDTAKKLLIENRHSQDEFFDGMTDCLLRANGITSVLIDLALISQDDNQQLNPKNVEQAMRSARLEIEDALIILDDFFEQYRAELHKDVHDEK